MIMVNDYYGNKWLLDILAYFLWTKTERFSSAHVSFAKELYQEILDELKENFYCEGEINYNEALFDQFEISCKESADLFYLEHRLKKLNELLTQNDNF